MKQIIILLLIIWSTVSAATERGEDLLDDGRQLFYASVSDKKHIKPAIQAFRDLMAEHPDLEGRALTYIGALEALRGKHAFFPHDKYSKTQHGLYLMDQGLAKRPDDIESLFIHGSTCYFLPFFFNRSEDAKRHFKTILRLLPEAYSGYDAEMVGNVINFIEEKVETTPEEQEILLKIKSAMDIDESF
ncbi:hypothetical protein JXO59_11285 [candidate division KSB1 bacterium]|nr:hypothetical protein [candidate division KSB1 bacterium]